MKRMLAILASVLLCLSILAGHPSAAVAGSGPAATYADTLQQLRTDIRSGSYNSRNLPVDDLGDIGYAFADLDADNSEELIVLSPEGIILFIYTLADGEVASVVRSTRDEYCKKIDDAGKIYIVRKDAGKSEETHYIYELEGIKLSKVWQLDIEYDESGTASRWQYQNKNNRVFKVSHEEGLALQSGIDATPALALDVTLLSEEAAAEAPAEASPKKYKILQRGSKGDAVLALQTRLKELGYLDGDVDGKFGKLTYAAVESFQAQHGLKANGIADEETQKTLFGE